MLTQEQIREIVRKIAENYHPEKIVLFGSYAYGSPSEESDLDLLIIKSTDVPRHQRGREVRRCLRGMKAAVDVVVYTRQEIEEWQDVKTSFITTVMEKGKVVYG